MEISYYDLLGMVKEGKAPKKISVSLVRRTSRVYIADYDAGEFNYYWLEDEENDENYQNYLSECFLESSMFDKCITILDEEDEFEDIYPLCDNSEQYNFSSRQTGMTKEDRRLLDSNFKELLIVVNQLIKNQKKIIEKLKELEK